MKKGATLNRSRDTLKLREYIKIGAQIEEGTCTVKAGLKEFFTKYIWGKRIQYAGATLIALCNC